MHITLSPVRRDDGPVLSRQGDVLTIDGRAVDLSDLPEGALREDPAPGCPWIVGPAWREAGVVHLTLVLPLGPDAPPDLLFPAPLVLVQDGPVVLPGRPG